MFVKQLHKGFSVIFCGNIALTYKKISPNASTTQKQILMKKRDETIPFS
jgi:hypothetical protein